jgi:lycopene cyclase domain-containing protein
MLTGGVDPAPVRGTRRIAGWAVVWALAAAAAGSRGLEYTGLACAALAAAIALDLLTGGVVVRHRRFALFAGMVVGLTGVFNGYLTARPLVLYDPRYQLDLRIGTIPVEDFVYGMALVLANIARCPERYGSMRRRTSASASRRRSSAARWGRSRLPPWRRRPMPKRWPGSRWRSWCGPAARWSTAASTPP